MLKAHGITPRWAAGLKYKGLSREVEGRVPQHQPALARLRHEYASRLVERGVPLAQVRDLHVRASHTVPDVRAAVR